MITVKCDCGNQEQFGNEHPPLINGKTGKSSYKCVTCQALEIQLHKAKKESYSKHQEILNKIHERKKHFHTTGEILP